MIESLENAREELIRADHLIYVSLKYTRTIDIFKHAIERMLNAYSSINDALLLYCKKIKKINEVPSTYGLKKETLMSIFKDDNVIIENVLFYNKLRKMSKAEYTKSKEYRRHVTMTMMVNGEKIDVNIDKIYEYYNRLRDFYEYVKKMVQNEDR